jgi:gamma-glutamyltranspeptidase
VLADGGNAYDVALACAFVQFIVDPHSCRVGGYLLLTSQPAGYEPSRRGARWLSFGG